MKTIVLALVVLLSSAHAAIADEAADRDLPVPPASGAPPEGDAAPEAPAALKSGWPEYAEATSAPDATAAPKTSFAPDDSVAPEGFVAPDDSLAPQGAETPEPATSDGGNLELPFGLGGPDQWTSPEGLSSALAMLVLLTVVSLAPAVLLMTTCFVRIVVVLGLVRQALGASQLPPTQVMTSIALFMTLLVMTPVWSEVYSEAIVPYTSHEITLDEAWDAGVRPVRAFMSAQIERTGNSNDVWLFYNYLPQTVSEPASYDDVPLTVLLPAFMLSELKTAFLIGFQIYLPFLVLDLVVASVTVSMGMVMMPPMLVSLPLKLLLFVLVDGWHLVVGMLLESFQTFS